MGDWAGRTVVITGASDGLGLAATAALSDAGAHVVMACRNPTKADRARSGLPHPGRAEVAAVDLADLTSVERLAARLLGSHPRLDRLINNAGVMMPPPTRSVDGIELQWATNHLGHFVLTGLLIERLLDTPDSRVVSVSSLAALSGDLERRDPTTLDGYRRFAAYADSKLASLVFSIELDRRLRRRQATTMAVAAHPGLAATNLATGLGGPLARLPVKRLSRLVTQPVTAGVQPILRAATDPDLAGGAYVGPAGERQRRGPAVVVPLPPGSDDPGLGSRLWDRSAELSGIDWLDD